MEVGEAERGSGGHIGVHQSLINPQEHEAATASLCCGGQVRYSNSADYISKLRKRKPSSIHIIEYSCLYVASGKMNRAHSLYSLSVLKQSEFTLANCLLPYNGAI